MEIEELNKRIERLQSTRAYSLISGITLGAIWIISFIIVMVKSSGILPTSQTFTLSMVALSVCMLIIGSTLTHTKIELYRVMRDIYRETLEKKSSHTTNTTEA